LGQCGKIAQKSLRSKCAFVGCTHRQAIQPVATTEKMRIIKAILCLITITAIVGMAIASAACPPLAFFAVPASLMLSAIAFGV
jgi:hypothetical protein